MHNPFKEEIEDDDRDGEYLALALGGDKIALESLILRHQSWIYNVAVNMVGDIQLAQDITQEVLIKIITKLSTYNPEKAAFRTWLYRIVLNHILTLKENRKEAFFAQFVRNANNQDWIAKAPDKKKAARPEHAVIAEETKITRVICGLLCIPRRARFAFVLGAVFDVTDRVGADICGISRDHYRKIVSRGRRRFYDFLNANCSLIKEDNPCKCGSQSILLIKAGILDANNQIASQQSYGSIRDVIGKTIGEFEESYHELNDLLKSQPFLKGPNMVQWLRDTLENSTYL
jgi:RNA polymerase sigma factor (sigma-70 family)